MAEIDKKEPSDIEEEQDKGSRIFLRGITAVFTVVAASAGMLGLFDHAIAFAPGTSEILKILIGVIGAVLGGLVGFAGAKSRGARGR
jgi:hypothetical protein